MLRENFTGMQEVSHFLTFLPGSGWGMVSLVEVRAGFAHVEILD
jgi:hypothetical protein